VTGDRAEEEGRTAMDGWDRTFVPYPAGSGSSHESLVLIAAGRDTKVQGQNITQGEERERTRQQAGGTRRTEERD